MKLTDIGSLNEMKREHIQEASLILTNNFLKNNSIWKNFELKTKQIQQFFVKVCQDHLQCQQVTRKELKNDSLILNYVFIIDGKIAGLLLNYQFQLYLRNKSNSKYSIKQFDFLEDVGEKLYENIDLSKYEKGKHIYGAFGVIDMNLDQDKKNYRYLALAKLYRGLMRNGFKSMVARISNTSSYAIYKKIGAESLNQVSVTLNNQTEKLYLIDMKFDNPIFTNIFSLLDSMEKEENAIATPKL